MVCLYREICVYMCIRMHTLCIEMEYHNDQGTHVVKRYDMNIYYFFSRVCNPTCIWVWSIHIWPHRLVDKKLGMSQVHRYTILHFIMQDLLEQALQCAAQVTPLHEDAVAVKQPVHMQSSKQPSCNPACRWQVQESMQFTIPSHIQIVFIR